MLPLWEGQAGVNFRLSWSTGKNWCLNAVDFGSSKVKQYVRTRLWRLTMAAGMTAEIPFHFRTAMRPVDPPQRPWEKCRLAKFLLAPQKQLRPANTSVRPHIAYRPAALSPQIKRLMEYKIMQQLAAGASDFRSKLNNGANVSNN